MNQRLQKESWLARRQAGRFVRKALAVAVLASFVASGPARAQGGSPVEPGPTAASAATPAEAAAAPPATPAPLPPPAALQAPAPLPPNPALDLSTPEPPRPSIFRRWWFWTAVGVVAGATVAVIVISTRGHAPPTTDLGNQEFQP
jgi:hypothetical protein